MLSPVLYTLLLWRHVWACTVFAFLNGSVNTLSLGVGQCVLIPSALREE